MFDGASNFAHSVDTAFLMSIIVSVFFLVLITFLMIFFVIKYSRKRNPKATNYHGNVGLEIAWTVIPTILVLILFWYGWMGYTDMSEIPEDGMLIEVTAQMWKWGFKYDNGISSDSLFVPINQPIKLKLKSVDVTHAFYIPAFRIKKDVYPGQERMIWFEPTELGVYDIACAEYCGLEHSYMYSKIFVLSENDFKKWLEEKQMTQQDELNNSSDSLNVQASGI